MADLLTADIVTAVRNKLADTAFDQILIIDAINFFVSELYHNTRTRRMESYDQIYVSANDATADYPDDIDVLINVSVTNPNYYDFSDKYVEYGNFMKLYPKWQADAAKAIVAWTDYGSQMRFSAPALTDTTIDIDYTRLPNLSLLTSATPTDTIEMDIGYKELVTLGALARCMESNEDYAEGSSERANLAPLVTAWIRNESRGFGAKIGPVIIRTNRNVGSKYSRSRDW